MNRGLAGAWVTPGLGLIPREAIPGMPDDLADAVYLLTEESRAEALVANWLLISSSSRTGSTPSTKRRRRIAADGGRLERALVV
jgi:hypothetical protein